jgi:hypothetical protein
LSNLSHLKGITWLIILPQRLDFSAFDATNEIFSRHSFTFLSPNEPTKNVRTLSNKRKNYWAEIHQAVQSAFSTRKDIVSVGEFNLLRK